MAVGAYGAAYFGNHSGLSLPLALLLGTVAGTLCGVVIGVITSRLDGVYLAVFTLAFALAVPDLINTFDSVTGGANGVPFAVPEGLLDINKQYWTMWAVAVAVAALVGVVRRTRVGRAWHVVRDTQTGASSLAGLPKMMGTRSAELGR